MNIDMLYTWVGFVVFYSAMAPWLSQFMVSDSCISPQSLFSNKAVQP